MKTRRINLNKKRLRSLIRKRYLIPAMLVLVVGGYIVYSRARSGNSAPTYVTAQAQKGMIDSTVTGSGNITVGSSANVVAATSGTVTDLAVKLGDHVTKGQVLFHVDSGELDVTLDKSYASYLQSQQQLDSAYAQSTQAQSDLDNAVGQAGAPTSANIAALNAKLTAAQASVASAQTSVSSAQQNLTQAQTNYHDNPTSQNYTALTQAQSQLASAQAQVASSNANLAQARSDLVKAQQQYEAAVENIQALSDKADAAGSSVTAAQQSVVASDADYQNQQQTAEDAKNVKSPIDGIITELNVEPGSVLGNSGTVTTSSSDQTSTSGASSSASGSSSASSGTTSGSSTASGSSSSSSAAAVIQNLDALQATVQVSEVDIYKLKIGQKATLTLDAVEGLSVTGKVQKIDASGTVSSGVVSYNVVVIPDITDAQIKSGMTVSAIITTQIKQDVITVPSSAVKTQGTGHYVEIMENGVTIQQTVTIGLTNDTSTEITSGLKEGDTVVTQTINASASTSGSSSGGFGVGGFGGGASGHEAGEAPPGP